MKDHLSVMSFHTSIQFRPTLQAQHDDATKKGQQHRADLFSRTPHQPQRQPSIMINLISITHIMPMTGIPAHPGRDGPAYSSSRAVYYDLR